MKSKFKLFLLVAICFCNSILIKAQSTFRMDYNMGSIYYGIIEPNNNEYVFYSNRFCKLNSIGNLVEYRNYQFHKLAAFRNLIPKNSETFYAICEVLDTCPNFYLRQNSIAVVDTHGIFHQQNFYKLSNCKTQATVWGSLDSDHTLLLGSRNMHQSGPLYYADGPFYLMQIDSNLTSVKWVKEYNNHWGAPAFGKQLIDKSFIIGLNLDTAGACVARLDSMGNVIWCKSYFRPKGMITDAVVDTDGNVLCVGFTDTIKWSNGPLPNSFYTKLFLMKIDTGGNVIWCKGYDDTHPYHFYIVQQPMIKNTLDGNFIIGATKATNLNANPNISGHACLIKVDGNGDTLWTNGYGCHNRVTFFSNMLPVSDGGYLLSGDFYGAISWSFGGCYVYKTDSLGYTGCGNLHDPVSITPLFPTDSNVVLLSVDDSVIVIATNITDTIYPFPPTADDCIVLAMPHQPPQKSVGIYPNPNKGEFKIEIPSPLKRESFVTVYNSMGKIILQKPIATEKDLQLDLSKFGKGIYLVKVREGDKVCSSKVVVQ